MAVPGRVDAAELLLALDPPPWFLRHVCAVAEIAAWLALRTAARGIRLDRRLVEAAGLLHDIDKLLGPDDPIRRFGHGHGSEAWLTTLGCAELGPVVAAHPVTRLADDAWAARWAAASSPEARIVAYADKRAGQRLESMAARFASWARRYPPAHERQAGWDQARLELIRARAAWLEDEVCAAAGVLPADVRRLGWTARALCIARGRRAAAMNPVANEAVPS